MLFCHLCLLISYYSLVFCILSFACSFCLTAWYIYFLLISDLFLVDLSDNKKCCSQEHNNLISIDIYLYEVKIKIVIADMFKITVNVCMYYTLIL